MPVEYNYASLYVMNNKCLMFHRIVFVFVNDIIVHVLIMPIMPVKLNYASLCQSVSDKQQMSIVSPNYVYFCNRYYNLHTNLCLRNCR